MTEERPPTAEEIQILRDNLNEHIEDNGTGSIRNFKIVTDKQSDFPLYFQSFFIPKTWRDF